MASFNWITKEFSYLTGRMGVYRLDACEKFFFEPTKEFYQSISNGAVANLNQAVQNIASFIECSTYPVIEEWDGLQNPLVTKDYDWTKSKEPAGMIYFCDPRHSIIHLNMTNRYSPNVLSAVIAHEITHHFLMHKSIGYTNELENERLTDLATVYLGLGKLTVNGYEPITWDVLRQGKRIQYSYKVGYLETQDLAEALYCLCTFRSISLQAAEYNLVGTALYKLNQAAASYNRYQMRKQLVGERQCPSCENFVQFGFHQDDDTIYCPKCGWDWDSILIEAEKKRKHNWFDLRPFFKQLIN